MANSAYVYEVCGDHARACDHQYPQELDFLFHVKEAWGDIKYGDKITYQALAWEPMENDIVATDVVKVGSALCNQRRDSTENSATSKKRAFEDSESDSEPVSAKKLKQN